MKNNHLILLACVVVLLLGLRVVLSLRGREVATDPSGAGLVRVVEGVDAKSVTWLRASAQPPATDATSSTAPAELAAPLHVVKADGRWIVTSASRAPADAKEVDAFVEAIASLQGEVRGRGEKAFADFGVDDAHALKVELGSGAEAPAATVLVGKQGDAGNTSFVRKAGDDRVFHVRADLRRMLGTFAADQPPPADHWVNKVVLDLKPEALARVIVERPDGGWVLRRDVAPATAPEGASADGTEGAPPPQASSAWTIEGPAVLPWPAKADALEGAVGRMARVRVSSVLDPTTPGCDFGAAAPPGGTVTFEETSGAVHRLHVGGRLADRSAGADEVVLRLDDEPYCYALARWSVSSLMPSASTLLDVPKAFADAPSAADVVALSITRPTGSFAVRRKGENEWAFTMGGTGDAQAGVVSRVVASLLGLRLDDVAPDGLVPADSRATAATVTAEAKGGKRVRVALLGERAGAAAQRYVRVDAPGAVPAGWVGVVSDLTADSLAPEAAELE